MGTIGRWPAPGRLSPRRACSTSAKALYESVPAWSTHAPLDDPSGARSLEDGLGRRPANHVALTPTGFLERAAAVYPGKPAVIHGDAMYSRTPSSMRGRRRLASALVAARDRGRGHGGHHGAERAGHARGPLRGADGGGRAERAQLPAGRPVHRLHPPARRRQAPDHRRASSPTPSGRRSGSCRGRSRSWTSSTRSPTRPRRRAPRRDRLRGAPRRGRSRARLGAAGRRVAGAGAPLHLGDDGEPEGRRVLAPGRVPERPRQRAGVRPRRRARCTSGRCPMFHCNGWTYTWAVTAVGGTHVCLRKVDPALIFRLIRRHGVTHLCGAPVVLTTLIHAPEEAKIRARPRGRGGDRRGGAAVGRHRGDGGDGVPGDAPLRADRVLRSGDDLRLAARVGRPGASRARGSTRRARAWRIRPSTG